MNHVRKAFGEDADLHEVLGLKDRDEAENPAKLRKAYFRKALAWHPDKTKEKDAEVSKEKFQAISFAYQVLKDPERRAEYNETGHVDEEAGNDDDNEDGAKKNWKDYFDLIFGKISTSQIDAFAVKYKCSEEEQRDVLNEYKKWKGDLQKMLEFVMLSEPVDTKRWVEDYIKPACEAGKVPDYDDMIQKSLKKLEAKMEKERQKSGKKSKGKSKKENKKPDEWDDEELEDCDVVAEADSDATETESDEEEVVASPVAQKEKKGAASKKAKKPQKAKPTRAKPSKKKKGGGEGDLFAMIQANQAKRAGGVMRSLGARYGVAMDEDDDPLGDDEFEKIQARLNSKKKRSR